MSASTRRPAPQELHYQWLRAATQQNEVKAMVRGYQQYYVTCAGMLPAMGEQQHVDHTQSPFCYSYIY